MTTTDELIDVLRVLAARAYKEGRREESMAAFQALDDIAKGDDVTDRAFLAVTMIESGDVEAAKAFMEKSVLSALPYNELALLVVASADLHLKDPNWSVGCKTVLATSQRPEMRAFAKQMLESTPS